MVESQACDNYERILLEEEFLVQSYNETLSTKMSYQNIKMTIKKQIVATMWKKSI